MDADCDVPMDLNLDNVGVANAAAPVECRVAEVGGPFGPATKINANDALQCLARIDAVIAWWLL